MITPAFYLPTTVLIIDDDAFFSQTMTELIDDENLYSITPEEFEGNESGQYIKYNHKEKVFGSIKDTFNAQAFFESEQLNASKELVSVIIIDNFMKPTNGMDFFRRMGSYSIGKVLITSFPQKAKGIKYINDGLIDAQIDKMDSDCVINLKLTIQRLKQEFFRKLSLSLKEFHSPDNPFLKPGLQETLNDIMSVTKTKFYKASKDLKEIYFYNNTHTKEATIRLATLEELQSFKDSYQAETLPKEILKLIDSGSLMPWLKSEDFPEANDWENFVFPTQKVKGNQEIFYSLRASL